MAFDRRKTGHIIWFALHEAKLYEESIIDAWGHDENEKPVRDARENIRSFNRLSVKLFGETETKLQNLCKSCDSVDFLTLKKMIDGDLI